MELGHLTNMELRDFWPKEASDFSPWLAKNLSMLGNVLGLELELTTHEAPVGEFSLDILARDLGRDRPVIIENQLEQTDHDHLGKLLTYAAGYDAAVIIWIAKEIREEHRQALDWLNQRTGSNTDFFGVVVELLKINDSPPACNFKLVAFPNEWRKRKISNSGIAKTSKRQEAYREFFQELIDQLREQHKFTGARIGQPQNWYAFSSGISGILYSFSFAQEGRARVEIYIDRGDLEQNKIFYDELEKNKTEIEREFSEDLDWEPLSSKRACRIALYRPGRIDDDSQSLEEIKNWAIDSLLKFKKVFAPHMNRIA